MKRRWLALSLAALLVLGLAGCGESPKKDQGTEEKTGGETIPEGTADPIHVTMEVQDYGTIELELDPNAAPKTVENFVGLVKEGFYDGLTFHRIMDGFMIQGGDPLGNGTGGADTSVEGEFSSNGWENPISHQRGVISMARSQKPDSASSQFFIVQEDSLHLDGAYAAFGRVTSGMEVVDQICKEVKPVDGNGTVEPEDQPVITKIQIVE